MPNEINTVEEFNSLTQFKGVVVIHFWAIWNNHDKTTKSILEELEKEFGEKVKFGSLDIDQKHLWKLIKTLSIKGVPTLAYFKNGNKLMIETGLRTKEGFRERIENFLSN